MSFFDTKNSKERTLTEDEKKKVFPLLIALLLIGKQGYLYPTHGIIHCVLDLFWVFQIFVVEQRWRQDHFCRAKPLDLDLLSVNLRWTLLCDDRSSPTVREDPLFLVPLYLGYPWIFLQMNTDRSPEWNILIYNRAELLNEHTSTEPVWTVINQNKTLIIRNDIYK